MLERPRPAYALIGDALRGAIIDGRLPAGAVLVESALAGMFGSSRSPVKQALAALEAEGLVRRFGGRGMAVGAAAADRRIAVTPDLLRLGALAEARDDGWTALYYRVERDIILASLSGRPRVNELALARHFGVGRTVARNLLLRAQAVGILSKDGNAPWQVVPLDRPRIEHLYELRIALEPPLLRAAVGSIPEDEIAAMETRLTEAARMIPTLDITGLDSLETDLHVTCLGYSPNTEMAEALRRTRPLLVVGKHIQDALPGRPGIDPFMDEHLAVLRAARAKEAGAACAALRQHLMSSQDKAIRRLEAFHADRAGIVPPYISV